MFEKIPVFLFIHFLYSCIHSSSYSLMSTKWQAQCWWYKRNKIVFHPSGLCNRMEKTDGLGTTGEFITWASAQMLPCSCSLCGWNFSDAISSPHYEFQLSTHPVGFRILVFSPWEDAIPMMKKKEGLYVSSTRTEIVPKVTQWCYEVDLYISNMEGGLEEWLGLRKPQFWFLRPY